MKHGCLCHSNYLLQDAFESFDFLVILGRPAINDSPREGQYGLLNPSIPIRLDSKPSGTFVTRYVEGFSRANWLCSVEIDLHKNLLTRFLSSREGTIFLYVPSILMIMVIGNSLRHPCVVTP